MISCKRYGLIFYEITLMCYKIDIRLSFLKSQRSFFIYRCLNFIKIAIFYKPDIVDAIT